MYNLIEGDPDLRSKMKLIGIGAGNSTFEVDVFRKTYNVGFPLFADGDFSIHKALGEVRTPYFIGIKIEKDGTHSVIYSKLGSIKNTDEFIDLITQAAGL